MLSQGTPLFCATEGARLGVRRLDAALVRVFLITVTYHSSCRAGACPGLLRFRAAIELGGRGKPWPYKSAEYVTGITNTYT